MDDDGLLTQVFRGQNAETWLCYPQRYSAYKQLSAVQTLALFMILLRDTADDWRETETETSKDTLEHLIAAFRKRFHENEVLKRPTTSSNEARIVAVLVCTETIATRPSSSHCHQDDGRHNANIQQ